MEFLRDGYAVILKSHHGKYLVAEKDSDTVKQRRHSDSLSIDRWTVEQVKGSPNLIRLRSCFGRYLTASDEPFLLGMTGKKVIQTSTEDKGSATEWEPLKEGHLVKLRTKEGKFLRANGGTPPWRNSVTHDVPFRNSSQDWILWEVSTISDVLSNSPSLQSSVSSASSFSSHEDREFKSLNSTPRSSSTRSESDSGAPYMSPKIRSSSTGSFMSGSTSCRQVKSYTAQL